MENSHQGEGGTFLLKGPNTNVPRDWKGFMKNGDNKNQLIKFLLSERRKDCLAATLLDKDLLATSGTECFKLCSTDGKTVETKVVQDLSSAHEEEDTRIIFHLFHQDKNASDSEGIVVRSSDTDVFLLLLHFCSQLFIQRST